MSATTAAVDPVVQEHVDPEGRRFGYVHVRHPGSRGLGIHCSAFFGAWGNARVYQDFRGYFHRLKMLGSDPTHDWLFLCDPYGVTENGTYYLGERGDLFVERAMHAIVDRVVDAGGYAPREIVTLGSSMGATGALTIGIARGVAGVVAVSPHIDLDICATRQNRLREVAFACPDGDPTNPGNFAITRRVRALVDGASGPLPRLYVQACRDDDGVFAEQVVPLVERWHARGGDASLDARPTGGHTSDWAPRALLLDATTRLLEGEPLPLEAYRTDPQFAGTVTRPPVSHRVRRRLSLTRKAIKRRLGMPVH
ncbi:MAG: alpha/beta hydrolase family protein [Acidimicrobiia bacterium]